MINEKPLKMVEVAHPPAPMSDNEAQMLDAAIKYTHYLRAKHPSWSPSKIQRRVAAHFQIKFV